MKKQPSHSGYHSPRARYNRNRKAMSDQELKEHDSQVNLINWILAIIVVIICVVIVALGGSIK